MNDPTPRAIAGRLGACWAALLILGYLIGRIVTDAAWNWDASAAKHLRGSTGQPLLSLMRTLTTLGSAPVLDAVFLCSLAGLLLAHRHREAVFLLVASPGSVVLVQVLKHVVRRPRPAGPHLIYADGFSWPSGHAGSSLAIYGAMLIIALPIVTASPHRFRARVLAARTAAGAVVTLIVGIGVSRVYLGVHYPTDVMASWALTGGWLMMSARVLHPVTAASQHPSPRAVRQIPGSS